jgi:hypothetical protein
LIRQVESGGEGGIQAKLVKIGKSQGLRLATPLLEQVDHTEEVEIQAAPCLLTIRPVANRFDEEDWQW